jgi:catechol 2,3-dioxygenase-like lactoylglutathione lyase family enzyme
MDFRLEVVVIPVSDVDRAKAFYQRLGWRLDADFAIGPDFRVVQLTPPGSACAVIFGTGVTSAAPGSAEGLQLVTGDIDAARAELAGPAPEHQTYGSWVSFADPDGNSWFVQEVTTRLPGRATSALAVFDSVAGLADALRRAEAAHGKYEQETGKADPDWPAWYARYMADEAAGEGTGK